MRRAASAVPGGEETIATIDALVAGSPAAAPELARARTIGERTAVARSVASTLPLGIEAFESFSLERELAARNAPFHLALGMGADPAELDSRSGNITPVSDRASGPGAPPTGGGSRPAQEATPPRRVPLTELPVWVQRGLVAQGVDIPGVAPGLGTGNPGPGGFDSLPIRTQQDVIDDEARSRFIGNQNPGPGGRDSLPVQGVDDIARNRMVQEAVRAVAPQLSEAQRDRLAAELFPGFSVRQVIPERLIELYAEVGSDRTFSDEELQYIGRFSQEDQQRALLIATAEARGRDSDREDSRALRNGAPLPTNEAGNPLIVLPAVAGTTIDRLHQGTLGFFTGENPIASIDQALQGLAGDARFSGEDLGIIRHFPDSTRAVAGRFGEEALHPFNLLVATRGVAIAASLTHLGRGGAITAKAFTPILTHGNAATRLAVEAGFSTVIESAADEAGRQAAEAGWSPEDQAVARIVGRSVAAFILVGGFKGAGLTVTRDSTFDEAALAAAIDAGESGLIAAILSFSEEASRLAEGR